MTIEWEPRELPEPTHSEHGSWLLLSVSDAEDGHDRLAAQLAQALNSDGAQCATVPLPVGSVDNAQLRSLLTGGGRTAPTATGPSRGWPASSW